MRDLFHASIEQNSTSIIQVLTLVMLYLYFRLIGNVLMTMNNQKSASSSFLFSLCKFCLRIQISRKKRTNQKSASSSFLFSLCKFCLRIQISRKKRTNQKSASSSFLFSLCKSCLRIQISRKKKNYIIGT